MFKGYSRQKYPKVVRRLFRQYQAETKRNALNKQGEISLGFKNWGRELKIKQKEEIEATKKELKEFFKKHNIESIKHGHYNPAKKKKPKLHDLDFKFGIGNPIKIKLESKYRKHFNFVEIKFKE